MLCKEEVGMWESLGWTGENVPATVYGDTMRKIRMKIIDIVSLFTAGSKKRRKIMSKYGLDKEDVNTLYQNLCRKKWKVLGENE